VQRLKRGRVGDDELVFYLDNDDGAVCTFGPVVYVVWRRGSVDCIRCADLAVESLVARYGADRRLFYVQRAPRQAGMMRADSALRAAAMDHFERQDSRVSAVAVAIEAEGFGGAIIRSVTAGVLLVRRTRMHIESFKDARDGVRWLARAAKDVSPFDADAMIRALEGANLALRS